MTWRPARPPPRNRSPSGAFDGAVPWAKYRRAHGRDQAPVYPSRYGKNGSELLENLKGLLGDECTEEELLELDAAFGAQADMREKMAAGDAEETGSERERLRKEHESGGEGNDPAWRDKLVDFMEKKGVAADETREMIRQWDEMPKNALRGGAGGALAPVNRMASDVKMDRLYPGISRIVGELPLPRSVSRTSESTALADKMAKLYPGIESIRTW